MAVLVTRPSPDDETTAAGLRAKGFKVLLFPPRAERDLWTYATCGMSYGIVSDGMELHLFSPEKSDDLVEILYALAHFHHTGSMLGLWHTVNFGRPWLRSSECNFGLISLPYLDGPTLENSKHGNDEIKFYWLIPVTGAEVDFKKKSGIEALESKFEESDFQYYNPGRPSLV